MSENLDMGYPGPAEALRRLLSVSMPAAWG